MQVYQELATKLDALANCVRLGYTEWTDKHTAAIKDIMSTAPSGSGIDNGTKLDWDRSNGDTLVFTAGFHHMNDVGYYDGWTEHTVTVRPSFIHGFTVTISGRDRNGIKDYLGDVFNTWLRTEVKGLIAL